METLRMGLNRKPRRYTVPCIACPEDACLHRKPVNKCPKCRKKMFFKKETGYYVCTNKKCELQVLLP